MRRKYSLGFKPRPNGRYTLELHIDCSAVECDESENPDIVSIERVVTAQMFALGAIMDWPDQPEHVSEGLWDEKDDQGV